MDLDEGRNNSSFNDSDYSYDVINKSQCEI